MSSMAELVDRLREEAALLQRYAPAVARAKKDDADAIELALREEAERLGTIKDVAAWSGYSEDYLRTKVRTSEIPDQRPEGSSGPILVRFADVGKKPHRNSGGVVERLARR